MELKNLKIETKELIANSLDIYHSLQNRNKLYRIDGIQSLSLYAGALRLGKSITIITKEPIMTSPGAGYPYPNGIRTNTRNERVEYHQYQYDYENIVCQILNEYGITIEQVIDMLNLDRKILTPVRYSPSDKIERQYNVAYRSLLHTIHNYYIASAKQMRESAKVSNPLVEMDIPTIISAIHYPNIDASNSISGLYSKLNGLHDPLTSLPDYLDKIESNVSYEEELCRMDENGQPKLYREKKALVMNKNIGKII